MNIVLVTELFLPGVSGMITAVRNLAEQLSGTGHKVTLVCPDSMSASRWAAQCGVALLPVLSVKMPARIGQLAGAGLPTTSRRTRLLLRDADVLHLHSPLLVGLAIARLARQERVPIVVTNHALPENLFGALRLPLGLGTRLLSPGLWKWIGIGIKMADAVTTPSNYGAQILRNRFGDMVVRVVSNGVRQAINQPQVLVTARQNEPFRALYVGRLQREKRVDELIHAVGACWREGVAVHLTVVGDGPDRSRLHKVARQVGVSQHVRFVGLVSDDQRDAFYSQSHFLWMASRAELQCCAALEAMAAGRPVIGARAGALSETVPDELAGRLYTPGEVTQIVEIMSEFRRHPANYYRLSEGALTIAARHRTPDICSAMIDVYSSLVSSPAPN